MLQNKKYDDRDLRVLILMPTGRDAALVSETLENSALPVEICSDLDCLNKCLNEGAGAILIAEEALSRDKFARLIKMLQGQPVWSDMPVVLLAVAERDSANLLKIVGTLLNITILERPLPKAILLSALRGALRARRKQYQTRDLLAQLKEADSQKDLFLATLSHELRTPLNSMLGWIKLLKTHPGGELDKVHALDIIERNANAQTQIINDILLLSRMVTGKFQIESKLMNLNEVVSTALEIVKPSAEEREIELRIFLHEEAAEINGDFDRLQQVFWNLLSNSVKFTPPKGRIKIEVSGTAETFTVRVTDSGRGIKKEILPFIFERFRQADNSYTRTVGGLGLGLSIVSAIITQHGGTVTAESSGENRGSTFIVTLPRSEAVEHPANEASQNSEPRDAESPVKDLRILIAEDDEDSREMLVFMLERNGFQVESVSSASEVLLALDQNQPQLIISDVGMPDMDGYELMQKVRKLSPEDGGSIPSIALTGYAGSQDRHRALDAGYQAHLPKPIDFDLLLQTIKELCVSK